MQTRALMIAAAILLGIFGLAVAWWVAGKTEIVTVEEIRRLLAIARGTSWAPVLVLAAFLVGAAVAFPVNLLILATAAVFGPWLGFLYSALGAFASAFLLYFVGVRLGRTVLERLFGPRLQRVLEAARKQGFWVVVAFRVVPVAPGTVINLGLGASGIRAGDFAMGTFIGMTPGLLLVSIMGDRLVALVSNPTLDGVGALLLCMVAYLAFVFAARAFLSRRR